MRLGLMYTNAATLFSLSRRKRSTKARCTGASLAGPSASQTLPRDFYHGATRCERETFRELAFFLSALDAHSSTPRAA